MHPLNEESRILNLRTEQDLEKSQDLTLEEGGGKEKLVTLDYQSYNKNFALLPKVQKIKPEDLVIEAPDVAKIESHMMEWTTKYHADQSLELP